MGELMSLAGSTIAFPQVQADINRVANRSLGNICKIKEKITEIFFHVMLSDGKLGFKLQADKKETGKPALMLE